MVHDRARTQDVTLILPMETRSYAIANTTPTVRQFAVSDPDGYVIRFSQEIDRSR